MRKTLFILFACCFSILHAQTNAIQNALKNYDYELAIQLISKEKKSADMDFLKAKCYKNITQYKSAIVLLEEIVRLQNIIKTVDLDGKIHTLRFAVVGLLLNNKLIRETGDYEC